MKIFDASGAELRKTVGFIPKFERIRNKKEPVEGGNVYAIGFEHHYEPEEWAENLRSKEKKSK